MTEFAAAYGAVLAGWPGVEVADVPGPAGSTRVLSSGRAGAPPLVLLPGGGATAAVWSANAAALSTEFRLRAPDLPGDAGFTTVPVADAAGVCRWLDGVVGRAPVDLVGHSYGAWVALTYALSAPGRVRRLVLLDPTNIFAGFSPAYLARAVPTLLRPSRRRTVALLAWETRGRTLPPAWAALAGLAAERPSSGKLVTGPRPDAGRLTTPTLVLLAGRSRAHDVARVAERAGRLPSVTTSVIPGATHHSLPFDPAADVNRALLEFLL